MKFQKYDIVLTRFPFTDLTATKKRPAVVIKDLEGDNSILCQITTKRHTLPKYEVSLKKEQCDGDIRFDSYIYVDIIATLYKGIIERKIGFIKDNAIKKDINEKLRLLLQ